MEWWINYLAQTEFMYRGNSNSM